MPYIGTNVLVEVQSALAVAVAVTAVTQASPGVATESTHGRATGDIVVFAVASGMVQLNGQAVRIVVLTPDTYELESLDTTGYSVFTAGTVQDVTTFETLGNSQNLSMPDSTPEKIDVTTLIDQSKQYEYGIPDAPDGSISGLYDPLSAGVAEIKAATRDNEARVFRVTWSGGQKTVFNANVSGGNGFELSQNGAATSTISFTPIKSVMAYAT